jgi:hypothetical protein
VVELEVEVGKDRTPAFACDRTEKAIEAELVRALLVRGVRLREATVVLKMQA